MAVMVRNGRCLSCALALLLGVLVSAGAADTAQFSGQMGFTPAVGRIDRNVSRGFLATIKVRQWALVPDLNSNGISPGTEPISLHAGTKDWTIDPASMIESKRGGIWTYAVKGRAVADGIKSLRVQKETDGSVSFRFVLAGIDGSRLAGEDPTCIGFALTIGDDTAFSGIRLHSPGFFNSPKLRVTELCPTDAHGGHQH